MKITFLGTGTSTGVPVLTCKCDVCASLDYRDKRLRSSILVQNGDTNILVDAGPDFRQQALRSNISHIDGIVFTHEHKDHTAGLDDVRPYNYLSGPKHIDIYAHSRVLNQLKIEYSYAFDKDAYPGVPLLNCTAIDSNSFTIKEVVIQPIDVLHHKLQVYGFRFGKFTYITDANFISDIELDKIAGTEILVLNALQIKPHVSHFNLDEALKMAEKIGANKTYFSHISHKLGKHKDIELNLPSNIELAYDGLSIIL